MDKDCWRLWIRRWSIINIISVIMIIITSAVLTHLLNEDYSDEDILRIFPDGLCGSAVKECAILKFDIIKMKRPDVVAVGSSRVMQFREEYFVNKSFYTMGGTAGSVSDAQETFNRIKENHMPKVIILGVDLWWMNPEVIHGYHFFSIERMNKYREQKSIYNNYIQSLIFVCNNEKIKQHIFHFDNMHEYDEFGGKKTIGLTAAARSEGYRLSDGSYQYGEIIKNNPSNEEKFKETYARIEKGVYRFEWTDRIDEVELMKLEQLITDIKFSGCYLIVILPPFPKAVYSAMDTNPHYHDYLYMFQNDIKKLCQDKGVSFFNFSNLAWIDSNDNETIDGFHGSDLAYAKMIGAMLDDDIFRKYVDVDCLHKMIQNAVSNVQIFP